MFQSEPTAGVKFKAAVKAGKCTDAFYTGHNTAAALLSRPTLSASNFIHNPKNK